MRWLLATDQKPDLVAMHSWLREGSQADAYRLGEVVARHVVSVLRQEMPGATFDVDRKWGRVLGEPGEHWAKLTLRVTARAS